MIFFKPFILSLTLLETIYAPKIDTLIKEKAYRKMSVKERKTLTGYFIQYGYVWRVNPLLAASVAWKESGFKRRPLGWIKCRKIKGKEVCKRVILEEGMMQVIPWEKSTIDGFRLCTGKNRRPTRRELRVIKTNICVGIYEMSKKREEVNRLIKYYHKRGKLKYCRWHNRKYWSWRHRVFFKARPHLAKYFYVAAYNWGCCRMFTRNRGRHDTVGYPIRVLKCFDKYNGTETEQPPVLAPKPLTEPRKAFLATKTTIHFNSGSKAVDMEGMEKIEQIAKRLKTNKTLMADMRGYTDYLGTYKGNIRLSRQRAKRVYNLLKNLGVPESQLSYNGMGEKNPIASNRTAEGRGQNRRVEILLR